MLHLCHLEQLRLWQKTKSASILLIHKTLNIVNQAIPIVYHKTYDKNARTMFKVASAFTSSNKTPNNNISSNIINETNNTQPRI